MRDTKCQEIVATSMGGEVLLISLHRPGGAKDGWSIEIAQEFKDHTKHVTSARFAPVAENASQSQFFVTVSRDWKANVYSRCTDNTQMFARVGTVSMSAEVTCCCWVNASTFVLAARDDSFLHYWDASSTGVKERLKTNLNALGDNVASFAVLALAVSPDGKLMAATNDKSRTILFQTFTDRQLRNYYGAVVDEYDIPSVCFSLDQSFLYVTSSLPQSAVKLAEEAGKENVKPMCGQLAIFEVRTGELMLRLPCHEKPIRCLDRHPYSEKIVTGSFDKTVRFWS